MRAVKVGDWLRLLNGFVFFICSDRLQALRSATAPPRRSSDRPDSVTIAGARREGPARRHEHRQLQSQGRRRGGSTFLPIRRYDLRARVREVAVMDKVSDLRDHLLSAEMLPADD